MSGCTHPFDQISYMEQRTLRLSDPQVHVPSHVHCNVCGYDYNHEITPGEFVQYRADLFERQTDRDPNVVRDMFYQPLEIGSLIVYPAMSGRSAQIVSGEIVDLNMNRVRDPLSQDELNKMMANGRHGEPYSMKVLPSVSSRWRQHWNHRYVNGNMVKTPPKPVTLWANAGSAVLINIIEEED